MQTPLQLDIWLRSYEGFDNVKNNMKQRNLNTVFANISITTFPTSDSFLLIMSHIRFLLPPYLHGISPVLQLLANLVQFLHSAEDVVLDRLEGVLLPEAHEGVGQFVGVAQGGLLLLQILGQFLARMRFKEIL